MRLEGWKIRHLGPFGYFEVDLNDYAGATLIALVGPNGAGKSTALELALPGAMFRSTPTRGSLQDLATARDAMIEARVVNGQTWTLRHLVDPVSGKSEAIVLDAEGRAVLDDAKVRSFDRWAAKHLPAPEVLYASVFGAQGSEGFLGLKPGERKSVLLRAIGLERLESLASEARERARAAKQQVAVLAARIEDEQGRSGDVETLAADLRQAMANVVEAERAEADARAQVAAAEDEARELATRRKDAERLADRRRELEADVGAARTRLAGLLAQTADARELVGRADAIRAAVRQAEELRAQLATLDAQIQTAKERRAAAEELERRRQRITESVSSLEGKLREIDRRIANNRDVLAEADAIRDAVDSLPGLEAERTRLESAKSAALAEASSASRSVAALQAERARVDARLARLEATLAAKAEVDAAVTAVHRLNNEVMVAKANVDAAAEALESLRSTRLQGAEERVGALRGALTDIRDCEDGVDDPAGRLHSVATLAGATLDRDDEAVRETESFPEHLRIAESDLSEAQATLQELRTELTRLEPIAARAKALDEAAVELADAKAEAERIQTEILATEAEADRARRAASDAASASEALATELEDVRLLAAKADPLSRAEARLAELLPQSEGAAAELALARTDLDELPAPLPLPEIPSDAGIREQLASVEAEAGQFEALARAQALLDGASHQEQSARKEVTRLETELAAVPTAEEVTPTHDLPAAQRRAAEAAEETQRARSAVAVLEQRLTTAREGAERTKGLDVERRRVEADLADWTRLAADLGRDGLQAAEIDAAGPELTELVNDLLHTCHGPRFTVSIETTKLSADGKRQLEGCEVRVIDTVRGRDADGSTFSGGERVIIGEAVSLALSMLACRRAGIDGPTLVRDESGAALDAENRPVYVAMLRRAAALVGARHVLFVSHDAEVVDLADARIEVG